MSKNIIICYRSKYNVATLNPLVPHIPAASTILETASSGVVVHAQQPHGPPLLSGFSSFLCVEQRAERSNGSEATDHSDTPQNCGQKWGKTRASPGGSCFPAVIQHIAGEQSVWRRQNSVLSWARPVSRHLLGPVGRRLRVSNRCRWCTNVGIQRLLLLGCSRLCSSFVQDWRWERREVTGEGSFTVGWWWEMFVVQHSNPSRPPEPLNELLRGHSEDTRGGIKDTQMLQFYR